MTHLTRRNQSHDQTGRSMTADMRSQLSSAGLALAVTALGTLLVLVTFTVPVATLTSTVAALGAGPGSRVWILSAMSVGAAAGLLSSGADNTARYPGSAIGLTVVTVIVTHPGAISATVGLV